MALNVGPDFKQRWLNVPEAVRQTFIDDLGRVCDAGLYTESDCAGSHWRNPPFPWACMRGCGPYGSGSCDCFDCTIGSICN